MSTTVAVDIANRKMERVDMAMLEALEAAEHQTLRWEDRHDRIPGDPIPGAPRGAPRPVKNVLIPGLETLVNEWCDQRPDLTVIPRAPIVEIHKGTGIRQEHELEPVINRCSISRLEAMVAGGLIEHTGQADEDSARKPTRELTLTKAGAQMLKQWRQNKVQGLPYPDPVLPTAVPAQDQAHPPAGPHSTPTARLPESPGTAATESDPTPAPTPPSDLRPQRIQPPAPSDRAGRASGGGAGPR